MDTLPNKTTRDANSDTDTSISTTSITSITSSMYEYHRHDVLTTHLQQIAHSLPPGTLCRFLTSKGNNGKKRKLAPETVSINVDANVDANANANANANVAQEQDMISSSSSSPPLDTPPLERITIQYPRGATYNLRKSYLYPIHLTTNQIIVAPETNIYRRLCWVHTLYEDSFVEIGCDFGYTCGTVVSKRKLGIDKSQVSLGIARENYPMEDFLKVDVLEIDEVSMQDILLQRNMHSDGNGNGNGNRNLVVAIDINGNRELEAVEACLDRVLNWWTPRLVIVKSRSLYKKLLDVGI